MTDFAKFDQTCKKYGLSNVDQALLLQVTPVMISRYRDPDGASMPASKWAVKLPIAVAVMKAVVANRSEPIRKMTPKRRHEVLRETMAAQNPDLDLT